MRSREAVLVIVPLVVVAAACSTSSSDVGGASLQSSCVLEQLGLQRNVADGEECGNVGYADCGPGALASKCVGSCAFDTCQSKTCASDDDCPGACKEYVVDGRSYGRWCDGKTCEHGTMGCPCKAGACTAPDQYYAVTCSPQNVCEGKDTCTAGCRVKSTTGGASICCGGSFCSGACVGTPCCG